MMIKLVYKKELVKKKIRKTKQRRKDIEEQSEEINTRVLDPSVPFCSHKTWQVIWKKKQINTFLFLEWL